MPTAAGAPVELAAVERELAAQRWHLRFSPAVEARYERDTAPARRRELLIAGVFALVVFDLFLVNDRVVRPEAFMTAVVWRLFGVTIPGAAVLWMVRRDVSARWREWGMASTLVLATIAASEIVFATTSAYATYDPFVFSLIVVAGNIGFPLRYVQALGASVLSVAAMTIIVVPSPNLPSGAAGFAVGLMAGAAVFTVMSARRTELLVRRSYLLVLRETLRGEAAARDAATFAELSNTDALTGVANRRHFEHQLAVRWRSVVDGGRPLGLVMIDIDNFKRFNDAFGHPAGDACLRQVARVLQAELRGDDFVARIGGEEFVAVLPGADLGETVSVAERLRAMVEGRAIPHDGRDGQSTVTVSVGVAAGPSMAATADDLVALADRGLYEAKRSGRNCVVVGRDPAEVAAAAGAARSN